MLKVAGQKGEHMDNPSFIRKAMDEHGITGPGYRIKVTGIDNAAGSDWATIHVDVIRPRCRKPCVAWDIAYYMPRDQIWWDRSSFTNL